MPKSSRLLTSRSQPTKTHRRDSFTRPSVIFQPDLIAGIDLIANAVKPTLGPLPRYVGVEATMRDRPPELLDDAGTIARRIIQIAHPTADVGAMMMRHALWRMREQCGDGSATMAVIAQALIHHAHKAIAAGAHPALLRRGIEYGVQQATASLQAQAVRPTSGRHRQAMLTALAKSVCHDEEMCSVLVEIVGILGPDGAIHVVNNDARRVDREYVEGALWESPWLTTGFATDSAQSIARITDAAVVVLDGKLDRAANVLEGLKRLYEFGHPRLVIVANDVSDEAKAVLIQAKLRGGLHILPIKSPGFEAKRAVALQDIATLSGARVLFGDSGGFANVQPEDVGHVRRAWATAKQFGLIAGRRDPHALRTSIAAVRQKIDETTDLEEIAELRLRLGRLCGGLAIVRVGGVTSKVQDERRDQAIRLSRALQMAAQRGFVAGGGAALLKAGVAVRGASADDGLSDDVAFGVRCVAHALEAPLATIAANAGFDPSAIVHSARAAMNERTSVVYGFDARSGGIADMMAAGIVDSVAVLDRAVRVAGSLAMTAITTDAVVHHRKPTMATMP